MSILFKEHSIELASVIKNQIETLASYEQNPPQIEIDIVKENIRKLYDSISSLHIVEKPNINTDQIESIDNEISSLLDEAEHMFDKEQQKQIIEQEAVLEEQALEDKNEPEIPDEKTIAKVHEEIKTELETGAKVDKPSSITEQEAVLEEQVIEDKIEPEPQTEAKVDKPGPKAKDESELKVKITPKNKKEIPTEKKVYVLDVEAEDEDDDLEEFVKANLNLKPIKSLKVGIGINDKFMFINDLYEGNAKLFNKSIKKLDALDNFQEALYLLGDMKDENLWEADDPVFRQFKIYIERRFI